MEPPTVMGQLRPRGRGRGQGRQGWLASMAELVKNKNGMIVSKVVLAVKILASMVTAGGGRDRCLRMPR